MSKLIDLGPGNRINFKNKRLVLPWLIDQSVFTPGSGRVQFYQCSITNAYFVYLCNELESEFVRSGPLIYFFPYFQMIAYFLSHHRHSKCLFNVNKIATFQYKLLLGLFPFINPRISHLASTLYQVHGNPGGNEVDNDPLPALKELKVL